MRDRNMGVLTVVALLTLGAIAGHVTISTARVTSLLATSKASSMAASIATTLRAVASNVSGLTTFVAFLATRTASTARESISTEVVAGSRLGAFAGEMSGLTTSVT